MENGRCYLHGGATPKGDGKWQRPVWPKMDTPAGIAKFYKKDVELAARVKKRERRVARMSTENRAAYDRWKATHAPTSKAKRTAAREHERQARDALACMQARAAAPSNELQALYDALAAAKAELRAMDRQDDLADAWANGIGVFG